MKKLKKILLINWLYFSKEVIEVGDVNFLTGKNGAGKSTTLKTVSGLLRSKTGSIKFMGEDITHTPADKLVSKGLAQVPEGRRAFLQMTVEENLEMGAYSVKMSKADMDRHLEEQYEIFPRLKERAKQKAGSMSGGEQQMLAIARGLMSDPELLMLDEPSLGLAPVIVEDMFRVITRINQEKKIPVLLVEQNAYMALSISDRCYIMQNGAIKLSGDSTELMGNEEVNKSYLGG